MRIVLTRHPSQRGAIDEDLRAHGFDVVFMPVTDQRLMTDTEPLRNAVKDLSAGRYQWLLLTSGNTVRALVASGLTGDIAQTVRIGVLGAGTAKVLRELTGITDPWRAQRSDASGMLAELREVSASASALLPQSAQASGELANGLTEAGWELTTVTAYVTLDTLNAAEPHRAEMGLEGHTQPGGSDLGPSLHSLDFSPTPDSHPNDHTELKNQGERSQGEPNNVTTHNPEASASSGHIGPVSSSGEYQIITPEELRDDDALVITSSSAAQALAGYGFSPAHHAAAMGEPTRRTLYECGYPDIPALAEPGAAGVLGIFNLQPR